MSNATTTKSPCAKCDGRGRLSWTSNANGVCFQCDGVGHLLVTSEEIAASLAPRAKAIENIAWWLARAAKVDAYDLCSHDGDGTGAGSEHQIAFYLGTAPADVAERGFAAVERLLHARCVPQVEVTMAYIRREAADHLAKAIAGKRRVVKDVRKAG